SEPAPTPPPMFRAAVDSAYGSSTVTVVEQADATDTIKVEESQLAAESAPGQKEDSSTGPVTPPSGLYLAESFLAPIPKVDSGAPFSLGASGAAAPAPERDRLGAFSTDPDPSDGPETPHEPVRGWLEPAVQPSSSAVDAEHDEGEDDAEQERFAAF